MPNTITAKIALSHAKGDLALAKAKVIENRRAGVDSDYAERKVAVAEYTVAALKALKLKGKSAFKELERAKASV